MRRASERGCCSTWKPWIALLIGAVLTPTDPVVASSLVTGRLAEANLPRWLRRSLQLEAGANDGLALVFVLVSALMLTLSSDDPGMIAGSVLTQLGVAVAGGVVLGVLAAKLVDVAEDHQAASAGFFLISALALALLTLGAVHALGGTGVLASFIAGMSFSLTLGERYAEELEHMQSALEHLLLVPVFLFFGALVPWDGWTELGWPGLAFAAWMLIVRRAPIAALALTPTRTPNRLYLVVRDRRRRGDLLRALRRALRTGGVRADLLGDHTGHRRLWRSPPCRSRCWPANGSPCHGRIP